MLLRILAVIYLALAGLDFLVWLSGGVQSISSLTVYGLSAWIFYLLSVLAVFCFLARRSVLGSASWRFVLLFYLLFRYLELKTFGAILFKGDSFDVAYRLFRYLLIAAPPAMAMLNLGFMHRQLKLEAAADGAACRQAKSSVRVGSWSDNLLP